MWCVAGLKRMRAATLLPLLAVAVATAAAVEMVPTWMAPSVALLSRRGCASLVAHTDGNTSSDHSASGFSADGTGDECIRRISAGVCAVGNELGALYDVPTMRSISVGWIYRASGATSTNGWGVGTDFVCVTVNASAPGVSRVTRAVDALPWYTRNCATRGGVPHSWCHVTVMPPL